MCKKVHQLQIGERVFRVIEPSHHSTKLVILDRTTAISVSLLECLFQRISHIVLLCTKTKTHHHKLMLCMCEAIAGDFKLVRKLTAYLNLHSTTSVSVLCAKCLEAFKVPL